jgi:hypothetical protein
MAKEFSCFSIWNTQSKSVHQSNRRKYNYVYLARPQKEGRYLAVCSEKNTSEFYSPNSKIMVVSTDMGQHLLKFTAQAVHRILVANSG